MDLDFDVNDILPAGTQATDVTYRVYHIHEDTAEELEATVDGHTVHFMTESFSPFVLQYTVDFAYTMDGQVYRFSLPGGGYAGLSRLLEILGVVNGSDGEDTAADDADEHGSVRLTLEDVTVSEETQQFVQNIVNVEFSSPDLVWVGRVDSDISVGDLKALKNLECVYGTELTEEQKGIINGQTVEAGEWALISLQPFTSEETLTVTMYNGDQFAVRVTDAQIKKTVIDARGDTWEITVTYDDDAQIPDGSDLKVTETLPDTEEYYEYYRRAADLVCTDDGEGNRHGYGRLFDISIWYGEEKIEPKSKVQVSMKLVDAPEGNDVLRVVHFGENEPEVLDAEERSDMASASAANTTELVFETDSFSVYAVVSQNASNGYGLGGQKFAIINRNVNEAVLGHMNDKNRIAASAVSLQTVNGKEYVIADEVTIWEFEHVNNNVYRLKAPDGKYLRITGNGTAELSTNPQNITISANGNGLRLVEQNGYALNAWNNTVADGFGGGDYKNNGERFTLYSVNELIQNQMDKISLTDLIDQHNGETPVEEVVIYTRVLNQNRDGYDYYAVAADGSLTRVYDIGDTIGWSSSAAAPDHLKWKLTVHCDDGEPNGYFDFQSMENGMYLIPTAPNGIKTDDPNDSWDLGVNMQGWINGTYGSVIERWDAGSRVYVGYEFDAVNKKLVPTSDDSKKLEFLFAHEKKEATPVQLHTVATLDGKTKGITVKMYDFDGTRLYNTGLPRSYEMTVVMGAGSVNSTNDENKVGYANKGLVSQTLTNGFPTATETGTSLSQLFNPAHYKSDASNIFVQQVYNETGYFSYDSSVNYAYLDQNQGRFILYRELAAPVMEAENNTPSGQKGNFFPFDSLQKLADDNKVFTNGISVKYDGDLHALPPDHPQYSQPLYKIEKGETNNYKSYFFGMTMEADFYQGPDGKDERGNDIIYEFNGDDDMWLYVDGLLMLDIGGCHGAVSGTINYSTGVVKVNGSRYPVQTNIKQIFKDANKLPDGSAWTEEGAQKWFKGNTFADYTRHSFKMFYMERGSYASNLKMRFNLLTIEPGSIVLEKKLPDNVQSKYGDKVFAYQIYTMQDGKEVLYTPPEGKYVTYEKSGERVLPEGQTESRGYKPNYMIGEKTYENVYLLRPDEAIQIPMENNEVRYFVREIGIDTDVFNEVQANQKILPINPDSNNVNYAEIEKEAVEVRGRVTYKNIPKETCNLRLEKIVDVPRNPSDVFRFDVLLEDSMTGQLVPYNQGEYYIVKTENGVDTYYMYQNGELVETTDHVAYKAGLSGSIDHIYPGYTILITGLLPGTDFKVTENLTEGDFPSGYQYRVKKVSYAGEAQVEGADGTLLTRAQAQAGGSASQGGASSSGTGDALVQITNDSVTPFSFTKIWRDATGNSVLSWPEDASIHVTIFQEENAYASYTIAAKDLTEGTKISADVDAAGNAGEAGDAGGSKPQLEVSKAEAAGYVFSLTGLPYGYVSGETKTVYTYVVQEETADGYQMPKYFSAADEEAVDAVSIGDGGIIRNDQLPIELPATGGSGTGLYSAFGLSLMGLALWLLSRRNLMRSKKP